MSTILQATMLFHNRGSWSLRQMYVLHNSCCSLFVAPCLFAVAGCCCRLPVVPSLSSRIVCWQRNRNSFAKGLFVIKNTNKSNCISILIEIFLSWISCTWLLPTYYFAAVSAGAPTFSSRTLTNNSAFDPSVRNGSNKASSVTWEASGILAAAPAA